MPSRSPSSRTGWLLLSLLVLSGSLGACRRPTTEPEQGPVSPGDTRPSPTRPTAPSVKQGEPHKSLEAALNTARDLFNRGENDLACNAVKQALRIAAEPGAASGTALQQQLSSYRTACEPL